MGKIILTIVASMFVYSLIVLDVSFMVCKYDFVSDYFKSSKETPWDGIIGIIAFCIIVVVPIIVYQFIP